MQVKKAKTVETAKPKPQLVKQEEPKVVEPTQPQKKSVVVKVVRKEPAPKVESPVELPVETVSMGRDLPKVRIDVSKLAINGKTRLLDLFAEKKIRYQLFIALNNVGFETVEDLNNLTDVDLKTIKNVDDVRVNELLMAIGLPPINEKTPGFYDNQSVENQSLDKKSRVTTTATPESKLSKEPAQTIAPTEQVNKYFDIVGFQQALDNKQMPYAINSIALNKVMLKYFEGENLDIIIQAYHESFIRRAGYIKTCEMPEDEREKAAENFTEGVGKIKKVIATKAAIQANITRKAQIAEQKKRTFETLAKAIDGFVKPRQ